MPVTLFTTTKPFEGRNALAQENALRSWQRLARMRGFEVLVIGSDRGAKEQAKLTGARHIADTHASATGAPYLNRLFAQARSQATFPIIAYLNADIILLDDFQRVVDFAEHQAAQPAFPAFLLTARRHDLVVERAIDFQRDDWQATLRSRCDNHRTLDAPTALDLFVFNRDFYTNLPPMTVGRTAWDNWLLAEASLRKAAIIDASPSVTLVHQSHDYGHLPGAWLEVWSGAEASANRALAGSDLITLESAATLTLFPTGLRDGYFPVDAPADAAAERRLALALSRRRAGDADAAWHLALESLALAGEYLFYSPELERVALADAKRTFLAETRDSLGLKVLRQICANSATAWLRSETCRKGRPLALWGIGRYGRSILDLLQRATLQPNLLVDLAPPAAGRGPFDIPVSHPVELERFAANRPFVIIGTMYRNEVAQQLNRYGYRPQTDYI